MICKSELNKLLIVIIMIFGLSGCLFGGIFSAFFSSEEGTGFLSLSIAGASMQECDELEGEDRFLCHFINSSNESSAESEASFVFSSGDLLILFLLDPLVIQLPDDGFNFNASYSHQESGTGGLLEVTSGLQTLPIDQDNNLTAEPGQQLVTIAFPAGAPTTGTFSFNFNFNFPDNRNSIDFKPLITGKVELQDGSVFYPPLLPCVSSMADITAITVSLPLPGNTVSLPAIQPSMGCDNAQYRYGDEKSDPPANSSQTAEQIPVLGMPVLVLIISMLGLIAGIRLKK